VTVPSTLAEIADQRFVSLTTFRRSGAPVATPVWVARDGDALVVTTPVESGKVKRLRHDPRVELRPCSRSGKVAADAVRVGGAAEVVPPSNGAVEALHRKYGLEYRLVSTVERLFGRGRRERVIVQIRPEG
jgi:PPOX class probable F420-dependent enzyme